MTVFCSIYPFSWGESVCCTLFKLQTFSSQGQFSLNVEVQFPPSISWSKCTWIESDTFFAAGNTCWSIQISTSVDFLVQSLFVQLITLLRATMWSLPKTISIAFLFKIHTSWFTPIQFSCIKNPGDSCSQKREKICPSQPSFFLLLYLSKFFVRGVCVASTIHSDFRLSFRVGQWHWHCDHM